MPSGERAFKAAGYVKEDEEREAAGTERELDC
jgi:hypothetical protein